MQSARSLFANHQLRCTEQRVVLYETLRENRCHPTAEELFHLARTRLDRLSLATVYNTLDALCDVGLAIRFPAGNGSCRYDANTEEHLHIRFRDTDELADVPDHLGHELVKSLPAKTIKRIEEELGIRIDGVSIQLNASRIGDS